MIELSCPWCEEPLRTELHVVREDEAQTCPECLTTWQLEDEPIYQLAQAA
jgi:hypothetical protein